MALPPLQFPAALAIGPVLSGLKHGVNEARDFLDALNAGVDPKPQPAKEDTEASAPRADEEGDEILGQLKAETDALLEQFSALLRRRLEQAGIDTDVPFDLTFDRQAGLQIAGAHPQAQQIAGIMLRDDDLSDQFRLLAATFSAIHEVEQVDQLHERYGLDSVLAADHYARVVGELSAPRFHLAFRGNDVEGKVE